MAYSLTLTGNERKAIDWVGHRNSNGNALFSLLWVSSTQIPDDVEWHGDHDITFEIPEHVAWEIRDNAESEDGFWPSFSADLAEKMQAFCDNIV